MKKDMPLQPLTISVADAAALSGMHKRTINRHLAAGRLVSRKVGGRRLILRDSLVQLIAGGESNGGS